MRQNLIELRGETYASIITARDFNTLLSNWQTSKQKSKDIVELNSIINQFDLIDIYRILHSTI